MGSLLKNILIIGGLIAIAVAGYYLVVIKNDAAINTEDGGNALLSGQTERETQEFLRRLNELQTIQLSTDIFADPRFSSFQDFTGEVQPVPYGRSNPFAAQ